MEVEELIELQRKGQQSTIIDSLQDLDSKDPQYYPKFCELIIAFYNTSSWDEMCLLLGRNEDIPPPYSYLSQHLKIMAKQITGDPSPSDRDILPDLDTMEPESYSPLESRYLGYALRFEYDKQKSLSPQRDHIYELQKRLVNPLFIADEFEGQRYRDRWYRKEFEGIIEYAEMAVERLIEKEYYQLAIEFQTHIHLARRPIAKGDPDVIEQILTEMDRVIEFAQHVSPNASAYSSTIEHKSRFLGILNRFDEAVEFLKKMIPQMDSSYSRYLRNEDEMFGRLYYWNKRWDLAIQHYEKAKTENNPVIKVAGILTSLAQCYYYRGDTLKAVTVIEELSEDRFRSWSGAYRQSLAFYLMRSGRYIDAERRYRDLIELIKDKEVPKPVLDQYLENLMYYIMILLELGDGEQVGMWKEEMDRILKADDLHKSTHLIQIEGITEGILKANGSRARDKVQALEIFEGLYSEIGGNEEFRRIIMTQYCDLLLLELEKFGEEEVLQLVEKVVHDILTLGKAQGSHTLQVQALLLQAKLMTVRSEYENVEQLFQDALRVSGSNPVLSTLVKQEEENFIQQLADLKTLVDKSSSLKERIEKQGIKEYFKMAKQQMVELGEM